jgi:hypothetical protein
VAPPAPLPPCPAAPLGPAGLPVLGAFSGAHATIDLGPLVPAGLAGRLRRIARQKAWVWAMAVSDEVLAAVAIVEAGWFAGGFAWGLDRRTGEVLFEASAAGLPGVTARVASSAGGTARLTARGLGAEVAPAGEGSVSLRARGADFSVDALLSSADAPAPFTLVAPIRGGAVRTTTKSAGLAASGTVEARGRRLSLAGGAGGFDFTAGILARQTAWRWAFATGRLAGAPFGFNLCAGFGVAADASGENAGFLGAPYRLPPVVFQAGGATGPWRVTGAGGAVSLTFRPQGAHAEARNLGLVSTRFVQVAGTFEGRIPGPDGAPVSFSELPGVVEDHWARW